MGKSFVGALQMDIALIMVFVIPHTVLASPVTKKAMGLPKSIERAFYVMQSQLLVHAQMHFWQNFEGPKLWDVSANTTATSAIYAVFMFGFVFLLTSTFALDHFDLCGLSQAFGFDINAKLGLSAKTNKHGIVSRAHYNIVAHPIMTGMMIGCWATPVMSAPRLLFAVLNTAYMVVAVKFSEEPKLEALHGAGYTKYLSTVPSFCPMFPVHARSASKTKSK